MILAGRYAIVTGANQGLGAAIAEAMAKEGASLLLCARDSAKLEQVRAALADKAVADLKILAVVCDVANPAAVDAMVATALAAFPRIDILVNNAGIYGPMGNVEDVNWQEWLDTIQINLMGTVYPCRAVLPAMKRQRYGKIINISGGGATNPMPGITAYAASKAAMVRFAESLALEVKEFGVDVNSVAPGALATRMLDQLLEAGGDKVGTAFHARMQKIKESGGTPLDVGARCCVWLASAASDGVTGKLVAAQWDPYEQFPAHRDDLVHTDIYTLRRIVPKDRGVTWGNDA
ncbi:MAG TPA: SDR family oxidoreductase [Rhizomicrobium sp.]|nr:SDR family oxidoreductase [Rhizomicrobium sp.]